MALDISPVQRNLQTRVTFVGLEAEDLFAILLVAVVSNVFGRFLHREMFGMPMNMFIQYLVPVLSVPGLMLFKYGKQHQIDLSTGNPAFAYVGEPPWHRLGQKLPDGASIDAWLRAARLEWELQRLPVQYLVNGTVGTMRDRFVLVRTDTHRALSVVSANYQIVQPREVLEFYRELRYRTISDSTQSM